MSDRMERDPAREDMLILVDGFDRQVGSASKERTHREGLLHRAFSVVALRETGDSTELLLSRRAEVKYHSGGLWANSCCSHPRDGEDILTAAARRTLEELGTSALDMREIGSFIYREPFEDGLCEYEYDHILLCRLEGEPRPDPEEISQARWVSKEELSRELTDHPEHFCAWAFTVLGEVLKTI